jgi:hypothetical protein
MPFMGPSEAFFIAALISSTVAAFVRLIVRSTSETVGTGTSKTKRHSFEIATQLAQENPIDQIVGATYPLRRWREAIDHALGAGKLGTLKVVFDPRLD